VAAETGIPALDTVLVWGGAVSLTAGLVTLAWRAVRGGVRLGRRVDEFIDDWRGEPERPGVSPRPGVMERMAGLEANMAGLESKVTGMDGDLQRIKHELYPNSGGSLRDAVDLANHRLALLCPSDPPPPAGEPPRPGTAVPGRDAAGDATSPAGDTEGDTLDVTSGDTAGDGDGDTGDTGLPPVPGS
jgi:hypothetical protein